MIVRTKAWMIFFSMVLMVSTTYSTYVLSLSMFGFLVVALFHPSGSFKFWEDRSFLLVSVIFFVFVFSGINSENISDWVHHVRMRLPFLALPVIFFKLPAWHRKELVGIHTFLIALLAISSVPVLYNIITDFDTVYKNIAQGIPVDTPVNHVKYSIFIAYASISGLIICFKEKSLRYGWEKPLVLALSIYLVIFLHVMAIRSGIAVFYLTLLILGLYYAYMSRSFKILGLSLVVVAVLPLISFYMIPSLNKRVHYMMYDINEYLKNGGDNYSDSDRINSLLVGAAIVRDNPIVGTGIGDIKDECTIRYQKLFGPEKNVLYPHNQYLFIAASTGILGLAVFMTSLLGLIFYRKNFMEPFLITLIAIYACGFMVDNLLERSSSAGFFAFFLISALSYRRGLTNQ